MLFVILLTIVKSKGQRKKAFLRVMKYSSGGVLEVIFIFFIPNEEHYYEKLTGFNFLIWKKNAYQYHGSIFLEVQID